MDKREKEFIKRIDDAETHFAKKYECYPNRLLLGHKEMLSLKACCTPHGPIVIRYNKEDVREFYAFHLRVIPVNEDNHFQVAFVDDTSYPEGNKVKETYSMREV